ncbi:hypothetical protein E6Q11_02745 [Candidatus Dojkabacteria bacterium]|uniref:Uncharacterized protein n=1 Tax=Candidatus Dojkabacteria bacterium TaxID=2099670 RepID=A0A5C7J7I2_9BACT|nr:MAG: hypothetical protein E6Q11_02745 [Candidatus Dojkabacteria bacterium]
MTNRDALGRFTTGNQVAYAGWQGLVQRRFAGDRAAARAWFAQLGRWAYGLNYRKPNGEYARWVKQPFRQHPGQPETFAAEYRQRFEFSLADVQPMEF